MATATISGVGSAAVAASAALDSMTLDEAKGFWTPEARAKRGIGRPTKILSLLLAKAVEVLKANGLTVASLDPNKATKTAKSQKALSPVMSRMDQIDAFLNSLELSERNYIRKGLGAELETDDSPVSGVEVVAVAPSVALTVASVSKSDSELLDDILASTPVETPVPASVSAPIMTTEEKAAHDKANIAAAEAFSARPTLTGDW